MLLRYLCRNKSFGKAGFSISFTCSIIVVLFLYINDDIHRDRQIQELRHRLFVVNSNVTFKYLYNPVYKCAQGNPYLMMIIKSKVDNFANRDAIRRTWAQQDECGLIRRVFSLGIPNLSDKENKEIEVKLRAENRTFGDLIQQDFNDEYLNNTLKTMMGFQWTYKYCSNVKYILFLCLLIVIL